MPFNDYTMSIILTRLRLVYMWKWEFRPSLTNPILSQASDNLQHNRFQLDERAWDEIPFSQYGFLFPLPPCHLYPFLLCDCLAVLAIVRLGSKAADQTELPGDLTCLLDLDR